MTWGEILPAALVATVACLILRWWLRRDADLAGMVPAGWLITPCEACGRGVELTTADPAEVAVAMWLHRAGCAGASEGRPAARNRRPSLPEGS